MTDPTKLTASYPNRISIENFKAFGQMVDVPIRPITLIFGENSAGKSSILHSLLFLNQMQHQPSDKLADITYTRVGGNSVDLGGFRQLKHGHKIEHELAFVIEKCKQYTAQEEPLQIDDPDKPNYKFSFMINFSDADKLKTVVFSFNNMPIVSLVKYDTFSSERFCQIEFDVNLNNFITCLEYPVFFHNLAYCLSSFKRRSNNVRRTQDSTGVKFDEISFINQQILYLSSLLKQQTTVKVIKHLNTYDKHIIELLFTGHRMPIRGVSFQIAHADTIYERIELDKRDEFNNSTDDLFVALWYSFCLRFQEMAETFNNISYLGPIRTIPTRNFDTLDSITRDPSTGSNAWEKLADNSKIRDDVNKWLYKFGTNKEIRTERLIESAQIRKLLSNKVTVRQILKDIDSGQLSSRHMLRFHDTKKDLVLSHRDMGVGISQVLPVIVNCVANSDTTVLIEQPELHLHPRLQGDVADLLIETAIKGEQNNTYLLETHSEALILRLLRRVREGVIKPDDIAILYVSAGEEGSNVTHIRIDDDGDFMDRWPNGFFEETYRDRMGF